MSTPAELAREMDTVLRALDEAATFLAGHDSAERARQLADQVRYSPLRTLAEQARKAAARVQQALENMPTEPGPSPWRDGGPIA